VRERKTRDLAQVLADVLDPVATAHRSAFRRLSLAWPSACGPAVARHTEPLRLQDALLVVGVRGRHWRDAVFYERMMLTGRLRRYWPKLRGIRVESLALKAPPTAPPSAPLVVEPDPRNEEIRDPELRGALDTLVELSRRR
jgi:hypothetical protein